MQHLEVPMRSPRLATALAFAALVQCGHHGAGDAPPTHQRRANGSVVLHGPSASYVRVEPADPASGDVTRSLVARVAFDERHLASIGPPVNGRVASVNVVPGDHVTQGQPLVMIHSQDIAAAQAQVAETRTARILAEQTARRTAALAAEGAASQADVQSTAAAALQARDEEARATASISAIGGSTGASDYTLRSPIEGTVVERTVSVGTEVHTDQDSPLLRVANLTTVWVIADVYEQDVPLIHENDAATVDVLAYPGRHFTGRVVYVGDVVDPSTRALRARIELPNTDLALRPGMFARVTLRNRAQGAADIPTSAILARRDEYFVFVRNADGSYAQREVQVGEQHGQHTTIVDGLHPGDMVVTEGAILLDAEANEAL
jgi:cobalt-zinc-cadmium efflux system membrane fusion protein